MMIFATNYEYEMNDGVAGPETSTISAYIDVKYLLSMSVIDGRAQSFVKSMKYAHEHDVLLLMAGNVEFRRICSSCFTLVFL